MKLKRVLRRVKNRVVPNEFERGLRRIGHCRKPKVLLYWNRGLGDIALGLCAVIARLRERLDHPHITVVTRSELEQAFSMTDVDRTLAWPELTRGDADGFQRACAALAINVDHFDLVLDKPDPTTWVADSIGRFVPRLRWNQAWNPLADGFSDLSHDRPLIVAHVSSETGQYYGYVKDWPAECWRQLFAEVGDKRAVQWLLIGHAAIERFERADVLDLRGRTSLPEVLAILRNRAQILVAVDSGILSLLFYIDETFPIDIVSLWSDPRQGVLKQAVDSPNARLGHIALVGEGEDVRRIPVVDVAKQLLDALDARHAR